MSRSGRWWSSPMAVDLQSFPTSGRMSTFHFADMAERACHPVLRARLSDVCWLLDRKRGKLALAAIAAYTDIVQKTDLGELKHRFAKEGGALQHEARDYLRRGLQIGRAVGWDKPETIAARDLVKRLRVQALANGELVPIHWFSDLDLGFVVSAPAEVGGSLDGVLATVPAGSDLHSVADLWRLAARAYQFANMDDDKNRCLAEAAEALVAEAEARQGGSAMLASHVLSAAIAQLHGIPGKKDRRTALRHRLIDIQSRVPERCPSSRKSLIFGKLRKGPKRLSVVSACSTSYSSLPHYLVLQTQRSLQAPP